MVFAANEVSEELKVESSSQSIKIHSREVTEQSQEIDKPESEQE